MTSPLGNIGFCGHGRKICADCIIPDDAAKRAYDVVKQISVDNDWDTRVRGYPYVAIRLSDGGSDGKSYANKQEAVRHQVHEQQCAYFSFRDAPNGFASPRDAAIYLAWHREAYDSGFRLPDPDDPTGGPDLIMPAANEHLQNQLSRLSPNGRNYG